MRGRLAIIVSAILVRLLCLALFDPAASFMSGDSLAFYQSSPHQAPGYPAFLALAGPLPLVIQSAATIAVALLARSRLPKGGTLAALLIVTSPFLVAYEYRILSDTLGWQLVLAAFLLILFPRANLEIFIAGMMLGCAALVRDTYQWLPLFAVPFALKDWRRMGFAAVVAFAVIVPWQISQDRISISEGRMGFNLWIGTWERDSAWLAKGLEQAEYPPNAFTSPAQKQWLLEHPLFTPESDRRFRAAALERIGSNTVGTVTNWAMRYPRLWLGTRSDQIAWRIDSGPLWYVFKAGFWLLNFLTLALGAIGILLCLRRYPLLLAPIVYVALVYLPFHNTETRYSLGALPFCYIFIALGANQAVARRGMEIINQRLHALRQLGQRNRRGVER